MSDVTLNIPIPAGVQSKQLLVSIERSRLKIALSGGLIVVDTALGGPIQPDESSWTLDGGVLMAVLEKARHGIWDAAVPEANEATKTSQSSGPLLQPTPQQTTRPVAATSPAPVPSLFSDIAELQLAPPPPPALAAAPRPTIPSLVTPLGEHNNASRRS